MSSKDMPSSTIEHDTGSYCTRTTSYGRRGPDVQCARADANPVPKTTPDPSNLRARNVELDEKVSVAARMFV